MIFQKFSVIFKDPESSLDVLSWKNEEKIPKNGEKDNTMSRAHYGCEQGIDRNDKNR